MADERWSRLRTLVGAALERPTAERERYLEDACGGDEQLHGEARSLIANAAAARGFLEAPALDQELLVAEDGNEASMSGVRIGPYRLERPLGHGGMGVVFLASRSDGSYRGQVAVKLLHATADESQTWRLRSERQILAGLSHPGIARLLDGGATEDGRPYLVMEYIEGAPIDRFCNLRGLGVRDRLELFLKVCDAVRYAHRQLVVHRDIKPSNILVTAEGEPRLLDFGIAKLLDPDLATGSLEMTRTGLRPLTVGYASPEQLRGAVISTSSDVYSLGVLLYELLCGRLPRSFTDVTPVAIERALGRPPTRPSQVVLESRRADADDGGEASAPGQVAVQPRQLARKLSGDLDTIVLTSLRDEPEQRYGSVEELANDVRSHLDGLPIKARPLTLGYQIGKLIRRHTLAVGAGVSALAMVLAFTVTVGLQATRIARERDKAQAVTDFLVDLFENADPEIARGEEITVREVLDEGASRVENGLEGQPEVAATLQLALGGVYAALGLYDQSDRLLQRALELREATFGPDDVGLVPVLGYLAENQNKRGGFEESKRLLSRALAIGERELGRDCVEVADCLELLAGAEWGLSEHDQAELHYRQAMGIIEKIHGQQHPLIASCLGGLAAIRESDGDYDGAIALLERALAIQEARVPQNTRNLAAALDNLGRVHWQKGELDTAAQYLQRSLGLSEALYGSDHPSLATAINNLAIVRHDLGDLEKAETLYRRALDLKARSVGERTPTYAASLGNLAGLLLQRGELAQARQAWQQVLAICEEKLGPKNPYAAPTQLYLAVVDEMEGRLADAERGIEEAVQTMTEVLGEEHPDIGSALGRQAELLLDLGRPAEAKALALRSLEILGSTLGEKHPVYLTQQLRLGKIEIALGRVGEAKQRLKGAIERYGELPGSDRNPDYIATLLAMGEVHRLEGDSEGARAVWEESLRLLDAAPGDTGQTASPQLRAKALVNLGRVSEARPLVEKLWAMGIRSPPLVELAGKVGLSTGDVSDSDAARE